MDFGIRVALIYRILTRNLLPLFDLVNNFTFLESYSGFRTGLRKRKRDESPVKSEPTIREEWSNEEELALWQIRQYWERYVHVIKLRQQWIMKGMTKQFFSRRQLCFIV